jgi:glycyl-tRNA synthetase (class II)
VREVLRFPPIVAPVKVTVFPLMSSKVSEWVDVHMVKHPGWQ